METSISAVTANRIFSKALVRAAEALEGLTSIAEDVDTSDLRFDVVQVVFVDEPREHVKVSRSMSGRICQVHIGIPDSAQLDLAIKEDLVLYVKDSVRRAVCAAPMSSSVRDVVVGKLDAWHPLDGEYKKPPPALACPYCGKILRTDLAKQCLECGMDWHDPNNVRKLGC